MEKLILTYLRFWACVKESKKLGLHMHPEMVAVEIKLKNDFMAARYVTLDVN